MQDTSQPVTNATIGNHQMWLGNGFNEIIPVIPYGAELHETSRVDPKARGKVPGEFRYGAWDGMGSWPLFQMNDVKAARYDQLGANVGLKMGEVWCALDVDMPDDLTAQAMAARVHEIGGGQYFIRVGQWPKFLVLFKIAAGSTVRRRQYPLKREDKTVRVEIMGITNKGKATQAVVAGMHPSGVQYRWNMQPRSDLVPEATAEQMDWLVEQMIDVAKGRGWEPGRATNVNSSNDGLSKHGAEPADPALVGPVVGAIRNDDLEYDDWVALGYAIKNCCGPDGWQIFEALSRRAAKNVPTYTRRIWETFDADGSSGFGKLVYWARNDNGGELPGNLEAQIRMSRQLKQAHMAGMPLDAPDVPVPALTDPTGQWTYAQDRNGNLVQNFANVLSTFMISDIWRGAFGFDAFNNRKTFTRDLPWMNVKAGDPVQDHHYGRIRGWFQSGLFNKIGKNDVIDAVENACMENLFDPLQDYLVALEWDGVPRINSWLWTYCGAPTDDPIYLHYLSQIGRKWLLGAVVRGMRPGEKVDNALIFEGPQGVGKSTAFKTLVPNRDWFGDSLPDFHQKDSKSYLSGKWIIEMSELTQMHRGELENMRAFMSREKEDFRKAFGREEMIFPRRCVFAGSTNRDDYLKDPAGERRFWIAKTNGKFDIKGLKAVRDQLWAEAYQVYLTGENHWLDPTMEKVARVIQQQRVEVDPWADLLRPHVDGHLRYREITIAGAMSLINVEGSKRSTVQQRRMRRALESLGFKRTDKQDSHGRVLFVR